MLLFHEKEAKSAKAYWEAIREKKINTRREVNLKVQKMKGKKRNI